jgi:hypothetical protein
MKRTSIALGVAFVLGVSGRANASWFTGPCETTGCHVFRWTVAAPLFPVLGAVWVVGTVAQGAAVANRTPPAPPPPLTNCTARCSQIGNTVQCDQQCF